MKIEVIKPVKRALELLPKSQREIIEYRFGLDGKKPRVLQEIADKRKLTRERIRQIESIAIKTLREDKCLELLTSTIKQIEKTLDQCNSVAHEDTICELNNVVTQKEKNYVSFLLTIGDSFKKSKATDELAEFWYTSEKNKDDINNIIHKLNKKISKEKESVFTLKDMQNLFSKNTSNKDFAKTPERYIHLSRKVGKNTRGEYGHIRNPEISMNSP